MKLFKYDFFDPKAEKIQEGAELKEPYIWAEETPGENYTEITTSEAIRERIKKSYDKKEMDGKTYFKELRLDLVYLFTIGEKSVQEMNEIESKLEPVIIRLTRGNWLTAAEELKKVTVEGALDQEIYNDIKSRIDEYISANY